MAHILILDDNDVACLALRGILTSSGHSCTVAPTMEQAWRCLHETPDIDLVVLELKLKVESGLPLMQRARSNAMFKALPFLVYTTVSDLSVVKSALSYRPQNYLLKPYRPDLLHMEIAKAVASSWRQPLEDELSFSAKMALDPVQLRASRHELGRALIEAAAVFSKISEGGSALRALPKLSSLEDSAEAVGAPRVAEYLTDLISQAKSENSWVFKDCGLTFSYAALLLRGVTTVEGGDHNISPAEAEAPPHDLAFWQAAEASGAFPLSAEHIQKEIDSLTACPVIDTVAAAFVMAAETSSANLNHLNDVVSQDPSLAATMLMAANHLAREGDFNAIEDTSTAVSMLGNVKLSALTKALPVIAENHLKLPTFSWAQYRLFQLGVARLSEFVRRAVEFKALETVAGTAGLLHDIGQLLVMRMHPYGFKRMIEFAQGHAVDVDEVQRRFLGVTARELGHAFFVKNGLPSFYCSVIQHVDTPQRAEGPDSDLVAVVSLARHLCVQNGIGLSGTGQVGHANLQLEETSAWHVLRDRVFPGFNLRKFQVQAHDYCIHLKSVLSAGQISEGED